MAERNFRTVLRWLRREMAAGHLNKRDGKDGLSQSGSVNGGEESQPDDNTSPPLSCGGTPDRQPLLGGRGPENKERYNECTSKQEAQP